MLKVPLGSFEWFGSSGALTYNLLWLLSFISFLRGCNVSAECTQDVLMYVTCAFDAILPGCLTDPVLLDSDWWRRTDGEANAKAPCRAPFSPATRRGRDDSSLRSSLRQDWALLPCRHCGPRPERSSLERGRAKIGDVLRQHIL